MIFSFRTRGLASGLTAALSYILTFIATKSYYSLEVSLSLPGVTLFNCVVIAVGLVLTYLILPETEGRTLEDIELHFSNKSKKLTDHKIPKRKKHCHNHDLKEISTQPVRANGVQPSINGDAVKYSSPNGGYDNCGFVDIKL